MDYTGNTYTAPSVGGRLLWGSTTPGLIGPGGFGGDTYTREIDNRHLLVIGDIIHCDGHVGIIWQIEYTDNTRTVDYANVTIIESTGAGWKVRKDRTWQDWRDSPAWFPNITIRRPRTD